MQVGTFQCFAVKIGAGYPRYSFVLIIKNKKDPL
jgi:hypothetical protein